MRNKAASASCSIKFSARVIAALTKQFEKILDGPPSKGDTSFCSWWIGEYLKFKINVEWRKPWRSFLGCPRSKPMRVGVTWSRLPRAPDSVKIKRRKTFFFPPPLSPLPDFAQFRRLRCTFSRGTRCCFFYHKHSEKQETNKNKPWKIPSIRQSWTFIFIKVSALVYMGKKMGCLHLLDLCAELLDLLPSMIYIYLWAINTPFLLPWTFFLYVFTDNLKCKKLFSITPFSVGF